MERMIGEKFEYGGKWYRVQPGRSFSSCVDCAFHGEVDGKGCDALYNCHGDDRTDRRSVSAVECEAPDMEVNLDFDRTPKADVDGWSEEPCRYDPQSRYYSVGNIEVLEIIKAKLTPDQYRGYLLGNVIKYATRLEHKGQAKRDAEKLQRYAEWLFGTFE